jgi:hypothetical protein
MLNKPENKSIYHVDGNIYNNHFNNVRIVNNKDNYYKYTYKKVNSNSFIKWLFATIFFIILFSYLSGLLGFFLANLHCPFLN